LAFREFIKCREKEMNLFGEEAEAICELGRYLVVVSNSNSAMNE